MGEKVMMTKREAPENFKMPTWPELAVHKVWEHAYQLPGVSDRLPDEYNGGRRTDKQFFWKVVIGQHEAWVSALVNDCAQQRKARAKARVMPPQTIAVRREITQMLTAHETGIRGKSLLFPLLLLTRFFFFF